MKLDFHLRARVHALETEAQVRKLGGVWSFAPCIRSTMVRIFYNVPSLPVATPRIALLVSFRPRDRLPNRRPQLLGRGGELPPGYDDRHRIPGHEGRLPHCP